LLLENNKTASTPLDRAIALHQAARLPEALDAYRQILVASPDDPEVGSLLGLAMVQAGDRQDGLAQLERAVAAEPKQAGFRLNLTLGLLMSGMDERAESEARAVLQQDPENARAMELLGDVAARRGDADGAAAFWRRSFASRFTLPLAIKLVRYQISQSHFDKAKAAMSELIPHFSDDPAIHLVNCELLAALRDWAQLERVARYVTGRFPDRPEGWKWLATAWFETGLHSGATAAYRRAIELGDPDADELATYAGLCIHALALEDAVTALDAAAALDPDHPGMLQRRALLHLYHGRLAEAEACCRRCLARDPLNVPAYTTLTRARRGRLTDEDLATLLGIAQDAGAPVDSRIAAAFAAGHVYDARDDADAAMAAYGRAHALAMERDRAEGCPYERAASEARMSRLPEQLDAAPLPAQSPGGSRPIFIVGMPRSGTTLAECVLGAHPGVVPCGERMEMRQVLHAWLALQAEGRTPDAATLTGWRDAVLRGLPAPGTAHCFTDKHPLNFEAVGLIARLFPDAAIVWMRRDPLETGLSAYCQEFNKRWRFVHRLGDIGHYYALHERVMMQWVERLPDRITVVRYETFAADIGTQARALVEAVGLDWDPRCLEFQSDERPIMTFSTVEAREPVSVRRGRAARYRRHLDELLGALATAGVALDGGH
jgi:tetratricopeptide (TPR) repeat protein